MPRYDYETKSSYTVDVIATDPWGLDDTMHSHD